MTTTINPVIEAMARAIGSAYDGDADPNDTPNNWGRAMDATLSAIRAAEEAGFVLVLNEANAAVCARIESRAVDFGIDFDQHGGEEAMQALYRAGVSVRPKLTEDGR